MNIRNANDPIGLTVHTVFTSTEISDRSLIRIQKEANECIKSYLKRPANKENCQTLQMYLNESLAKLNQCPDSDAKDELVVLLEERINILQSGIDLTPGNAQAKEESYTRSDDRFGGWQGYNKCYERAMQQYQANGYRNLPITYDPNTVEGYIRNIPNVKSLGVTAFVENYAPEMMKRVRFVKRVGKDEHVEIDHEFTEKTVDLLVRHFIKKLVFVQLTQPSYIVVENRYPEADEMFTIIEEH